MEHNRLDFTTLSDRLGAFGHDLSRGEMREWLRGQTEDSFVASGQALGAALPVDWLRQDYRRIMDRVAEDALLVPGIVTVLDRLDQAGIS